MKTGWKKRIRRAIGCPWLIALICLAGQDDLSRFDAVAHGLVTGMNESHYVKIHGLLSRKMQESYSLEKTEAFFGEMVQRNGLVQDMHLLKFRPPDEVVYSIIFERGAQDFYMLIDGENRIYGLRVYPHSNIDRPTHRKHETMLYPPVRGRWKVLWGGDSPKVNIHHDKPSQTHAVNFVGLGKQGARSFKEKGRKNTDYFAFEREVLTPAEGVVVQVIQGVRDNSPGSVNPYSALGNAVFIKHGDKEVSVLAHLRQGSITVKPGDRVAAGQVIARCGNSGGSSEPMLHYHLQDTEVIQDALGIPCYFEKVFLERQGGLSLESDYTPLKDDILDM